MFARSDIYSALLLILSNDPHNVAVAVIICLILRVAIRCIHLSYLRTSFFKNNNKTLLWKLQAILWTTSHYFLVIWMWIVLLSKGQHHLKEILVGKPKKDINNAPKEENFTSA